MASTNSNCSSDVDDDISTSTEKYEEKMLQLIENCTEKSAKVRIPSLKSMCEIMQHRNMQEFFVDRKITVLDLIEKSFRRGKIEEQELAAQLLILLIIQIGKEHDDFKSVTAALATLATHNSVCLQSLAMFYFLTSEDIGEIVNIMTQFEQMFIKTEISENAAQMQSQALGGWSLLASLISPSDFCSYVNDGNILR